MNPAGYLLRVSPSMTTTAQKCRRRSMCKKEAAKSVKMRVFSLLLFLAFAPYSAYAQNARVVSVCGAPTLTVGPVDQMTMDTTGRLCMGNGAPPPTGSVWSASDAAANGMTLTNGGLTVTPSGAGNNQALRGTVSHNTGKWYVEFLNSVPGASRQYDVYFLLDSTFNAVNHILDLMEFRLGYNLRGPHTKPVVSLAIAPSAFSPQLNDVLAIAVDFDGREGRSHSK